MLTNVKKRWQAVVWRVGCQSKGRRIQWFGCSVVLVVPNCPFCRNLLSSLIWNVKRSFCVFLSHTLKYLWEETEMLCVWTRQSQSLWTCSCRHWQRKSCAFFLGDFKKQQRLWLLPKSDKVTKRTKGEGKEGKREAADVWIVDQAFSFLPCRCVFGCRKCPAGSGPGLQGRGWASLSKRYVDFSFSPLFFCLSLKTRKRSASAGILLFWQKELTWILFLSPP